MGHKKTRKQQRRGQRWDVSDRGDDSWSRQDGRGSDLLFLLGQRTSETTPAEPSECGRCKEFVEDQEGGRGTCLHPGSGVLSPWSDTAACPFFDARRGGYASQHSAHRW